MTTTRPPNELVVGVDLGGTNMQAIVVDPTNKIVGRKHACTEPQRGADDVIDRLVETVNDACRDAGTSLTEIGAVGIAAAGAIDIPNGVILVAPNLHWENLPLLDRLREKIGRPVVLENDVNGAVWGEHHLGAGAGHGDVLGVWVGTGIGGGLILDGHIHHGAFFTAGEIGHTILTPNGEPGRRTVEDHCGRNGVIRALREQLDSHPESMLNEVGKGDGVAIDMGMLAKAYAAGDALTQQVVHRAADLLGIAIANWVTVLALDTVIVGGGMTEALGEPYLQQIRRSFEATVFPARSRACRLVSTQLKGDAGPLGAALLARQLVVESKG
ncbi:MAG: ROK family protein [Planctomycetes bacterium]|nr:ROK family protein [Planctomycetota bacterium]